jgi:hypothetical protein
MKSSEMFREALRNVLSKKPTGEQGRLADALNIKRTVMNDFIHGRRNFSENRKELIADALGYKYEEFLAEGRRLLEGKPAEPEHPLPIEPPSEKLRRISDRTGEGNTREGIIALFQDRERARQMILRLVAIEKADKEQFVGVDYYLKGVCNTLNIKKSA